MDDRRSDISRREFSQAGVRIQTRSLVACVVLAMLVSPILVLHGQDTTRKPNLFHREQLTGDWGGTRTTWKDKGFEFLGSVTQFYQGIASGGLETGSEYNGTAQAQLNFDFGKLTGWKFWSAEIKGETRFGGPLPGATGTVNPVNTAVIVPGADGTVSAITTLTLTKLIPVDLKKGELLAVAVGRVNLLDAIDEHFFAGGGTERFFNMAQIGPLTVLREIPLITNAINLAYIHGGEALVTFSLMDPNDHSTDAGLSNLFADGVTFAPGVNLPVKYFSKSAKHSIGGAITTKAYTPFAPIRQIILPGPSKNPIQPERGSWSAYYTFRQYVVERAKDDGWGFFGQLSFSNKSTSPITTFFDAGFGGNGLLTSRQGDEFGLAYAYTDLSSVLKDNLDLGPLTDRLRVEHQLEMFYNLHIAPWLQVTGDLQVIRPTRPKAETAIVPGGRVRIVF